MVKVLKVRPNSVEVAIMKSLARIQYEKATAILEQMTEEKNKKRIEDTNKFFHDILCRIGGMADQGEYMYDFMLNKHDFDIPTMVNKLTEEEFVVSEDTVNDSPMVKFHVSWDLRVE